MKRILKEKKERSISLVRLSPSTYFAFFYMLNYNLKGFLEKEHFPPQNV